MPPTDDGLEAVMRVVDGLVGETAMAIERGQSLRWEGMRQQHERIRTAIESYGQQRADDAVAALPCYWKPDGQTCNYVMRFPYDEQPCPSCSARARRAGVAGG